MNGSLAVRQETSGFKLRGARWWMIGLVAAATTINYIDRQAISLLMPVLGPELHISEVRYGVITACLLLAYMISQTVSGKFYDRYGTRVGFIASIVIWSLAAMCHAFIVGFWSFALLAFILAFGEAGNWPGAAKAVAEWFPIRERAIGMAIFNSGAALGSVIAPPFILTLQMIVGWRVAFVIAGSLGFVWLIAWLALYWAPGRHPYLGKEEAELIAAGQAVPAASNAATPSWTELFRYKQVWAIVIARLLVDPVWWFFVLWLPNFLSRQGFSIKQIGMSAWFPYLCASAGSLFGGWLAGRLIRKGMTVNRARKTVLILGACLMPASIIAVRVQSPMQMLLLLGVVLFGFQMWISNVQTLPSDFFADKTVASVAGLGGTGAAIGSMCFTLATGWIVTKFSYTPVATVVGLLGPIGTVLLFLLAGRIQRVDVRPAR